MAGEWIKVQYVTPTKPEMLAVATKLELDPDVAFARWFRIWCWADANLAQDGHARNVTLSHLDRVAGVTGIAQAFVDEGWICVESDGLTFVNFDRFNGKSSKERSLACERQRNRRAKLSRPKRDKSVTREEKRRKKKEPPTPFDPLKLALPDLLDKPEFREAWQLWVQHRIEIKHPLTPTSVKLQLAQFEKWGPTRAIRAMRHTALKQWRGIREPDDGGAAEADGKSELPVLKPYERGN